MRKLALLFLLLVAGTWSARPQHFDRGIETNATVFVPKGSWIMGGTISYSTHSNDNYRFLVIEGINSSGYNFQVSPLLAYAFKNNMAAGARFAYNRQLLKLDRASVDFDDIDLNIKDYYSLRHTFQGMAIYRYYITLGNSKRFALYNELQLALGGGQAKLVDGTGNELTGTYERSITGSIGMSPGLVAFVNNNIAIEVNVGVLGFNFNHVKQITDQVYKGYRNSSKMNFKVNIFSIGLGIAYYL